MGFSRDPGALPFATIRTQKWANRIEVGELVQIQGEHGCRMPKTPARITHIEPFPGLCCPADLAHIPGYTSEQLYRIYLDPVAADDPELKRYCFPV